MTLDDLSRLAAQLDGVSESIADLEHGNADAIEDAMIAAWELQSGK